MVGMSAWTVRDNAARCRPTLSVERILLFNGPQGLRDSDENAFVFKLRGYLLNLVGQNGVDGRQSLLAYGIHRYWTDIGNKVVELPME
jgi:hypothetical protein